MKILYLLPIASLTFALTLNGCLGGVTCNSSEYFQWKGTTYTEALDTTAGQYCDPSMVGTGYSAMPSNSSVAGFILTMQYDLTSGATPYQKQIAFTFYGNTAQSYNVASIGTTSEGNVYVSISGETCTVSAGTVTIGSAGSVGEAVSGSYNFTTMTGSDCPSAPATGNFSIVRYSDVN